MLTSSYGTAEAVPLTKLSKLTHYHLLIMLASPAANS